MSINLSEKLKQLRKEKNISQEKLAEFLNVSFQAVSKWETGLTCPDISLLPHIARYFGITVDELLQVEKLEADKYFQECSQKSEELFRNGERSGIIPLWLEAYRKLPNDIRVKEMLMSIYFDTDKAKYQNEIIELGTEIYNAKPTDGGNSYYKGQAINQIARTYYENGNTEKADEWARKAHQINHSQEMLYMQIHDEEDWLTDTFSFTNYWYFDMLFYMAARLNMCNVKCHGDDYVQKVNKAVASVLEAVYPNDDMGFESLQNLYLLHRCIAEDETNLGKDEKVIEKHLNRALECALISSSVKEHKLTHPLVYGWTVQNAPSDNKQILRIFKEELNWQCFQPYKDRPWYQKIQSTLDSALTSG